jgi:hypothetical protein
LKVFGLHLSEAQRVMRNANAAKEELKAMEETKYTEGPSKTL